MQQHSSYTCQVLWFSVLRPNLYLLLVGLRLTFSIALLHLWHKLWSATSFGKWIAFNLFQCQLQRIMIMKKRPKKKLCRRCESSGLIQNSTYNWECGSNSWECHHPQSIDNQEQAVAALAYTHPHQACGRNLKTMKLVKLNFPWMTTWLTSDQQPR